MKRPSWQSPHNQTLITFTAVFFYTHIFTQSWWWISDIDPIQIWTWHTRWNCWILIHIKEPREHACQEDAHSKKSLERFWSYEPSFCPIRSRLMWFLLPVRAAGNSVKFPVGTRGNLWCMLLFRGEQRSCAVFSRNSCQSQLGILWKHLLSRGKLSLLFFVVLSVFKCHPALKKPQSH